VLSHNFLPACPGDYNEEVYKALDYVVHEARQRHLRLILVLTNYGAEGGGMRTIRRYSCTASPPSYHSASQALFRASGEAVNCCTQPMAGMPGGVSIHGLWLCHGPP